MAYATAEELRRRIGTSIFSEIYALSDGPDSSGPPDAASASVQEDLESAGAEIDGAISFRYALPVTGTRSLALLKDWNLTLAEERAYARCAGSEFAEKIKRRVDQVRKYLDMIRSEEFRLPDAPENAGQSSGGGIALVSRESPIFDRRSMRGF